MPINNQDQTVFLNQLKSYLNVVAPLRPDVYRPNNVATLNASLTQGHCSGITALWLYYKHKKKEKYFYDSIMQPILAWDGTKETLSKELEEAMEYALSSSVWLQGTYAPFTQATSGMVAHPETKYERSAVLQSDYDILLGSIKQKEDPTLRKEYEIAFVFKNEELKEFLEDIGADKSVRLGSSDHVIGLVYESDTQEYVLFDPNGFLNEQTKERFFEKRFTSDKTEDLIKNIQSAFLYKAGSPVTGLTISIFDDSEKPMPTYSDRVEVIKEKLEARLENQNTIDIDQGADYDNTSPLFFAAADGHLDTVRFLLEKGAQIDQKNKKGISIIHGVSERGHKDILELLLDSVDPTVAQRLINEPMSSGRTPLHSAAIAGHTEIVRLLLSKGAKVDTQAKQTNELFHSSSAPLQDAVRNGHKNVVELLLNSPEGPGLISFQTENMTPLLYIAAENGHLEIAELLLKQGAKIERIQARDFLAGGRLINPIHIAIINGHQAMVKLLLNSPEGQNLLNEPTDIGETPLELAIQNGRIEILKWLLEKKGNTQEDKNEALYLAVSKGQVKIVQYLLEQAITVDGRALRAASENKNTAILAMLLDSPAGQSIINDPDFEGSTALMMAAKEGHLENVKLLLNKGAKIDHVMEDLSSVLHAPSRQGHNAVLELLLDSGAQAYINSKDYEEKTPLDIAIDNDCPETVALLLKRGAVLSVNEYGLTPMHTAVKGGRINVIKALLDFEAKKGEKLLIDMPARHGATPLFLAVYQNDIKMVEFLVSQGAKIDTSNSTFNPILCASKYNRGAIAKVLQSALEQQASSIPAVKSEEPVATMHIETETKKSFKPGT